MKDVTMADDFNEVSAEYANRALEALQTQGRRGVVTEALTPLLNRMMRSVESLAFLFTNNPNEAAYDGAMILRGIYDAHLQALHILKDPEARARLYLDFQWVESHKLREVLASNPSSLAKFVMSSPKRATAEPHVQARFEAVKANYAAKGGSLRNNWYRGTLADLARDVGYEPEYFMFSRLVNGVVHSSAFALKSKPQLGGGTLITMAWTLVHRAMGKVVEYENVALAPEVLENLRFGYENLFHMDNPPDLSNDLSEVEEQPG
jgi:hypothetical protein